MRFHGAAAALIFSAMLACTPRVPSPKDAHWDADFATFRWWGGEVQLPRGVVYQVDQGTDSFAGHFTSANGALIIYHDIGGYAGAYASRKSALAFEENTIDGARVWTVRREQPDSKVGHTVRFAVTFPDSGCANFFLNSSNPKDAAIIDSIARSFRPNGRTDPGHFCRADP